jgi:hypothetical protein
MSKYNTELMIENGGHFVNINGRERIMIAGMTQAAAAYDIERDEIIVIDANDADRVTLAGYRNFAPLAGFSG